MPKESLQKCRWKTDQEGNNKNPCGRKRMRVLGGSGAEASARIMIIYHLMWVLFPHHVRLTGMIVIYLSLCLSYASRRIENR
jgi:hypothetical protein